MPGVIFDMDGVLVDSGPAHLESWQILARRCGLEVSRAQFESLFGRRSPDIIRTIWGAQTPDDEIARLDAEKEAAYRELIAGDVPLMPGCQAALETLEAAGHTLAVATSGPPENLDLILDAGLRRFFQATVNGFEIENGKPAPDCFLLAAQRCDLKPRECVVVEDAPVGIAAALAAGMRVIGLAGTHPPARLLAAGAHEVVDDLRAITPASIDRLLLPGGR